MRATRPLKLVRRFKLNSVLIVKKKLFADRDNNASLLYSKQISFVYDFVGIFEQELLKFSCKRIVWQKLNMLLLREEIKCVKFK